MFAFPLLLLRGTPLHEAKDSFGLIEDEVYPAALDIQNGGSQIYQGVSPVVSSPSFSGADWEEMAKLTLQLSPSKVITSALNTYFETFQRG